MEHTPPPPTPWDRLTSEVTGAAGWSAGRLLRVWRALAGWWAWACSPAGDAWSARQAREWRGPLWIVYGAAPAIVSLGPGGRWLRASVWVVVLLWAAQDLIAHGVPRWIVRRIRAQPGAWLREARDLLSEAAGLYRWAMGRPRPGDVQTRLRRCAGRSECGAWVLHRAYADPEHDPKQGPPVCWACRQPREVTDER